jgi:prepilin-type N-terminal cleavage/methylation domain-containing protein
VSRHELRGFSLAELLTVVAVAGLLVAWAMPSWLSLRRRTAVRAASAEIRTVFHSVRSRAVARSNSAAVHFARAGSEWQFAIYDDGDILAPAASPVQFHRSSICSFSPVGASTTGTIYLTDDAGSLFAVRVYGPTAKVHLLRYEPSTRRWERG